MIDDMHPYLYKTRTRQDLDALSAATAAGHPAARRPGGSRRSEACSTRAPSGVSCTRPTTARPGCRSSSTCRPSRSTTCGSRTATWCWGRTAVDLDPRRPDADPRARIRRSRTSRPTCCRRAGHALAVSPDGRRRGRGANPPAGAIITSGSRTSPRRSPGSRSSTPTASSSARWADRPSPSRRPWRKTGARQGTGRRGAGSRGEGEEEEEEPEAARAAPEAQAARDTRACTGSPGTWSTTLPDRSRGPASTPAAPRPAPLALPGSYTVKLIVDDKTVTAPLEILPDPRVRVRAADLPIRSAWRWPFATTSTGSPAPSSGSGRFASSSATATPCSRATAGPGRWSRRRPSSRPSSTRRGEAAQPQGADHLRHPGNEGRCPALLQLGWLYGSVLEGDGPPTQGMREAAARLSAELSGLLGDFQSLIDKDLAELNRQAKALDLPHHPGAGNQGEALSLRLRGRPPLLEQERDGRCV